MKLAVIGTGYVGLVTGTCFSEVGHEVTCIDIDHEKITSLKKGKAPIYEPGLEVMIQQNQNHERLHFTTDLESGIEAAEAIFIAVGTPQDEDGSCDLRHVETVASQLGKKIKSDTTVVVKSTVPVGTCDSVSRIISRELKIRDARIKVAVASNPEFLQEGKAVNDFMRPDRIIIGVESEKERALFQTMYRPFILDDPSKLFIMDRRSSELTKYSANAMLAARISFMNEISRLCEKVGANVDNVRLGIGADPRIGRKFLYAGPGYGGSCFPKDVSALIHTAELHDLKLEVMDAVKSANDKQKQYVTNKIIMQLPAERSQVTLWGLAFKPGTDDIRESPAMNIVEGLLAAGHKVVCHDPEAKENFSRKYQPQDSLCYADDAYTALEYSDALVLVTEWSEYRRPNWEKVKSLMKGKHVFDLRNQYEPSKLLTLGMNYYCVGRPDISQKGLT